MGVRATAGWGGAAPILNRADGAGNAEWKALLIER
jgi:hypothetical protein